MIESASIRACVGMESVSSKAAILDLMLPQRIFTVFLFESKKDEDKAGVIAVRMHWV